MKRRAYSTLVIAIFSSVFLLNLAFVGLGWWWKNPSSTSNNNKKNSEITSQTEITPPTDITPVTDPLVVETEFGTIKGREWDTETYCWLGVPFAKPPLGELRWKAPEDPEPWPDVKITTEFSEPSMQQAHYMGTDNEDDIVNNRIIGSEDCLYLNIWTPKNDDGSLPEDLPVYFYVHGGGNTVGQAAWPMYHGAHLAEKANVVVISVNYRLGIAGWFYHPVLNSGDPLDDSGNYALLDIVKSMQWTQNNIENFGGDPDCVTVAGQSAGAMNLYAIITSPYVKEEFFDKGVNLFHRAVIQSGAMLPMSMDLAENASIDVLSNLLIYYGMAETYEEAIEIINSLSDEQIKNWLMETPLIDMFEAKKTDGSTLSLFAVSILMDGYVAAIDPYDRLYSGNYIQVPMIIGCCETEAKLFLSEILADPELYGDVMFGRPHPDNLSAFLDYIRPWPDELAPYLDWIIEYAYQLGSYTLNTLFQLMGVDIPAILMNLHRNDIFVYLFAWDQEPEPFDFLIGACHGTDLPFIFGNVGEDESFPLCNFAWSEENEPGRYALSDAVITYWSNFMRNGDPGDPDGGILWWEDLPDWDNYISLNGIKRIVFDATDTEVNIYMT